MKDQNHHVEDEGAEVPDAEGDSFGWLELLAADPDAVWDQPTSQAEDQETTPPAADAAPSDLGAGERSAPEEKMDRDERVTSTTAEDELDFVDSSDLDADELMWLDEMETVPDMNMTPEENEDLESVQAEGDSPDERPVEAEQAATADDETTGPDMDEVPDDPDEAIAWLEQLAAKQGAPSEELSTLEASGAELSELSGVAEDAADDDLGEIPEDPDEAMAWLERLAARQGADMDELPSMTQPSETVEPGEEIVADVVETAPDIIDEKVEPALPSDLDEALGWLEELTVEEAIEADEPAIDEPVVVSEEPPTPAVAHDVEEAMAGADLLFTEPESIPTAEPIEEVEEVEAELEDGEDAMAWLEQLAARQGAPIEELATIDEEPEEMPDDEQDLEEALDLAGEPIEAGEEAVVVDEAAALAPDVEDLEEAPTIEEPAEAPTDEDEEALVDEAEAYESEAVAEEDMAWLDTLGAVDADSWLEAEAAAEEVEIAPEPPTEEEERPAVAPQTAATMPAAAEPAAAEPAIPEPLTLTELPTEGPAAEALTGARQSINEGALEEGLSTYADLVEKGELLPFLIDDLEVFNLRKGPDPALQRVLGDAYARNGQLQKALQTYREALDNL